MINNLINISLLLFALDPGCYQTSDLIASRVLGVNTPTKDSSKISSTHASYDGNTLLLNGSVQLEHGLGKMASEIARLEKEESRKDLSFSKIFLNQNVQLILKNDAELLCETASLDFIQLKGTLFPKEGQQVCYLAPESFFQLFANSAEIDLAKDTTKKEKNGYLISTIHALNDVLIKYRDDFHLQADQAVYENNSALESQSMVTAFGNSLDRKCLLSHNSDLIHANHAKFYPNISKIVLTRPKGTLQSTLIPLQKEAIEFESDELIWDHQANTLILKGNPFIKETALGEIQCEQEIEMKQKIENQKQMIQSIATKGRTSLKHVNDQKNLSHELIAPGSLYLNNEEEKIYINGLMIDENKPSYEQVYYQQGELAMRGDSGSLQYSLNENHFEPKEIVLTGNVQLFSMNAENSPRCALADQLIYHPETKQWTLFANPGKKVLFWDEKEGLSVSATQIIVTTDEMTKKESVKGVGNVRFSFNSTENQILKKLFPFYQPPMMVSDESSK